MSKFSTIAAMAVIALPAVMPGSLSAQADSVARRQQRTLDSLTAALREATARLDSLARAGSEAPAAAPQAPARAAGAYMNIGFDGLVDAGWSSNRNVRSIQRGDHDPAVRGFTIPAGEMTLDAVVDPFFRGFANINYKLDETGESAVELEEVYFLSTSLPHNLQLKGGQFLTDFGRQNATHPHAWAFVDQPLVIGRMFGPEGMRGQGARVSWLLPTSFYTEAMVTVLNPTGGTAYSFLSDESTEIHGGEPFARTIGSARDLLVVPRLTGSFDPTDNTTLLVGASAALGPNNAGSDARTSIFGGDMYWKWKSPTAGAGFPFVSLQAEAMTRRYDTGPRVSIADAAVVLPAQTLSDQGGYVELLWGVKPRVVLGARADRVTGDALPDGAAVTAARVDRTRLSPNFTWYPTEFSKVRLQYNFDDRAVFGRDHSLWLQFEFIMGAHAAHKF